MASKEKISRKELLLHVRDRARKRKRPLNPFESEEEEEEEAARISASAKKIQGLKEFDVSVNLLEYLLERCVGRFTQNVKESMNNLIWRIAPNVQHSGAHIVQIVLNIAACTFNEGAVAYLLVIHALKINIDHNCAGYYEYQDAHVAEVRARKATREGRIARRQQRSSWNDATTDVEGTSYGPEIAN
ncbi:hypothetical protein EAI_14757 [Harpegnathos saltator]|uniref:Uncharacterized protein n=1 Tax=Harpegnathos saltator TaxID=610380 RepID=E2BVB5_HARSA|nr:hypothetical protein EAI_14757 [Harpegnathos saltator]